VGANADVVRSAWEAFGRQDLDSATADMEEAAEIIVPESLPWGGSYRGPGGFKEMIGPFMSHFEEFRPTPDGFFEADDRVFFPLSVQAKSTSGNDMSGRALWMYQLRDGKITRAEIFADTANTVSVVS
jgi:ketosteroid isomerase-like protein